MEIKSKIKNSVILAIALLIFAGILLYKVIAASTIPITELIQDGDLFWNDVMTGDRVDESGIEDKKSSKYWICFSHDTVSGMGSVQEVKAIVSINTNGFGTYISRTKGIGGDKNNTGVVKYGDDINKTRASIIRQLNYLIYAATVDSSKGLVGKEGSSPSKNALYYYLNTANLRFLMGDFVEKQTKDYTDIAKQDGAKVLEYAEKYAETETDATSSNADITASSDEDATVTIAESNDGNTYSYIGPFSITSNGDIDSVTLKTGSTTHEIVGYTSKVGYVPKDIYGTSTEKGIPTNGQDFWILTKDTNLDTTTVKVIIKTSGTTGGGTIINPETGKKTTGYIRSRIIFLGHTRGQATAVYHAVIKDTNPTNDQVTLTATNTPGKLIIKKYGAYTGDDHYELVNDFGFKMYRLDGSTKKYLRINDQDTIKENNVVVDSTTSYDASESSATTIYTTNNGTVTIRNLSTQYEYYLVEADTTSTNYKAEILRAAHKHDSDSVTVNVQDNVIGPITTTYDGEADTITRVTMIDYRKTGNLTIEKVDADDYNTKLGNVQFKVANAETGKYVKANLKAEGEYEITDPMNSYTTNEAEATTFVTNSTTGRISITGLDVGEYEIIETSNPGYGYESTAENVFITVKDSETVTATIENEKYVGDLKIQKQDADDENIKMEGISFRIKRETETSYLGTGYVIAMQKDSSGNLTPVKTVTGNITFDDMAVTDNPEEATTFVTDQNGSIEIRNIIAGMYTVEEISAGNEYGYFVNQNSVTWEIISYEEETGDIDGVFGDESETEDSNDGTLQEPEGIVEGTSVVVEVSNTSTVTGSDGSEQIKTVIVRNKKQTGNLKIEKQDADDSNTKMEGISFRIKRETSDELLGSGYVIAMQKDSSGNLNAMKTVTGSMHIDGMQVTNNPDEATTFVTDENGKVEVYNILAGTYTVEEISVGDEYGYYVNDNYVTWEVSSNGGTATTAGGTTATIEVVRQASTETSENAVGTGAGTDVKVKNEKQTGNLKIEKQDADDSNTKMEGISFKIRRETSDENLGSGYVIAMQKDSSGNLKSIETATGRIHLDGMDVTNNSEQATTFITDENGLVEVYNILAGTYTVEEISVGDKYGYYVNDNYVTWEVSSNGGSASTAQGTAARIEVPRQKSTETNESAVGTGAGTDVKVKNEKQTGNLKLQKKDADNDSMKLQGISFRLRRETSNEQLGSGYVIGMQADSSGKLTQMTTATGKVYFDNMTVTNNANQATTFVTDAEGLVEIYNILVGRYTIEEVSVGDNFGYDIDSSYISWEVTTSGGSTSTLNNSTTVSIDATRQPSTQTTPDAASQGTNSADQITTKNTRKYIKIRGYAWEDKTEGKDSTKDYQWVENTADKRLANIEVRLKDSNGNILDTAITDENGEYVFGNYDEDDKAIQLKIDDLVGAYIEFEYNGMSYQSIAVDPQFEKVTETDSNGNTVTRYYGDRNTATDAGERTAFNNRFATISKGIATGTDGSVNEIKYDYNKENHESKVIWGDANSIKYGYDGQTYPISGVYDQYKIRAVTQQSSTNALCTGLTPEAIRQNAVVEIGGLNLGVEERQMPDLYVLEDIQDVKISLNGYDHTYEYANRFKDYANYLPTEEGREYLDTSVRFESKYINGSYSREVYESDISYNSDHSGELQVKVTYLVKVTNESSSLHTRLNTLVNYFDANYLDNVVVTVGNRDEGRKIEFGNEQLQSDNIGMKRIDIPVNDTIEDGQTKDYYITYTLSNDAINSIINGKLTLESVSEVGSYSSYDESGNVYAGIDVDSAPDTVQREINSYEEDGQTINRVKISEDTLEDDVDKAPSLILSPKNGRIIEGTVWEDSAIADRLNPEGDTARERIGDGEYNALEENVVRQVRVELITYDENNNEIPATLYQWNQNKTEHVVVDLNNVEVYTDSEGKYKFEGIIPGKYYLRYTYGNNSVIVDPSGTDIANIKPEDYKSTIYRGGNQGTINDRYWYRYETSNNKDSKRWSDARDNDEIIEYRTSEETTDEITYATIINESGNYAGGITANTEMIEFGVEYEVNDIDHRTECTTTEKGIVEDGVDGGLKFTIDNIDFGIIERPKQYLIVNKEIINVQITLANGNDLVNGNPQEVTLQGVRLLDNGEVYIEIDNEIIQGATLKITYKISVSNKECELDYNTQEYYIYGIHGNDSQLAIAKVKDMYDYVPEGMVFEENSYWEKIEITEDNRNTILASEVYDDVIKNQNVVHLTSEGYNVYNGMGTYSEASTEMVVSTQLTSTAKDMTYENDVEIVKLENRKTTDATPGNYSPTENSSWMDERVPSTLPETDDTNPKIEHPTSTVPTNATPDAPGLEIVDGWGPSEPDDNEAPLVITPPTGSDESTSYWTYGIIGISVLIVVGLGVVIIKKKIL